MEGGRPRPPEVRRRRPVALQIEEKSFVLQGMGVAGSRRRKNLEIRNSGKRGGSCKTFRSQTVREAADPPDSSINADSWNGRDVPTAKRVGIAIRKGFAGASEKRTGFFFNQKNGAYPDTLNKLAPEFLDVIPVDPFTGQALVYRKNETGFVLYSVGPDMKDDNGTPEPRKTRKSPPKSGNFVWDDEKAPHDIAWTCTR